MDEPDTPSCHLSPPPGVLVCDVISIICYAKQLQNNKSKACSLISIIDEVIQLNLIESCHDATFGTQCQLRNSSRC